MSSYKDLDERVFDLIRRRPRKTQTLREYFGSEKPAIPSVDVEDALRRLTEGGRVQCLSGVWRPRGRFVEPSPISKDRRDPKRHKRQTHFGWD